MRAGQKGPREESATALGFTARITITLGASPHPPGSKGPVDSYRRTRFHCQRTPESLVVMADGLRYPLAILPRRAELLRDRGFYNVVVVSRTNEVDRSTLGSDDLTVLECGTHIVRDSRAAVNAHCRCRLCALDLDVL